MDADGNLPLSSGPGQGVWAGVSSQPRGGPGQRSGTCLLLILSPDGACNALRTHSAQPGKSTDDSVVADRRLGRIARFLDDSCRGVGWPPRPSTLYLARLRQKCALSRTPRLFVCLTYLTTQLSGFLEQHELVGAGPRRRTEAHSTWRDMSAEAR